LRKNSAANPKEIEEVLSEKERKIRLRLFKSADGVKRAVKAKVGKRVLDIVKMRQTRYRIERCNRLLATLSFVREYRANGNQTIKVAAICSNLMWSLRTIADDWITFGVYVVSVDQLLPVGRLLILADKIAARKGYNVSKSHYYFKLSEHYSRWCARRPEQGKRQNTYTFPYRSN